ncbi:MAG: hypothetical protein V2A78_01990 [bacterium]
MSDENLCELCGKAEAVTGVREVRLCGDCFAAIANKQDGVCFAEFWKLVASRAEGAGRPAAERAPHIREAQLAIENEKKGGTRIFSWLKRLVSCSSSSTREARTSCATDFGAVDRALENAFDSITEDNVSYRVEHASEEMIVRYVQELGSNISQEAHEVLVRIGAPAVPYLIPAIRSTEHGSGPVQEEGSNAIVTLEGIGPAAREAIPALQAILDDPAESALHKQLAQSALRAIRR